MTGVMNQERTDSWSGGKMLGGLLLAVLLTVAGEAAAESEFSRRGGYLKLGVLGATYTQAEDELEDELRGVGVGASVEFDETAGFSLVGGFRAHPHIAVEGEIEFLAPSDISESTFGDFADLWSLTTTVNAKAFALTGRFQPYGLVGIGVMRSELSVGNFDDDYDGFAARFGAGLEVYLGEHWALDIGADYVLPTGDVSGLDYLSFGAGVILRF